MTVNTTAINPSEALKTLKEMIDYPRYSVMLHGSPGIGKSDIIRQLAEEMITRWLRDELKVSDKEFEERFPIEMRKRLQDIRLTTIDAPDLRGLPNFDHEKKRTVWYTPEFYPDEDDEGPGILFFDELKAAERRLQASTYSILLERRIGNYQVPKRWMIIAASNDMEHGAISYDSGTALNDRLIHLKVVSNKEAFIDYAMKNDFANEIIVTVKSHDLLENCEERITKNHDIGYSPRGWERVNYFYKRIKDRTALENIVNGIIGQHAAAVFFDVVEQMKSNTSVEDLLKAKPKERKKLYPENIFAMRGLLFSLANYITDAESVEKVFEIITEIEDLDTVPNTAELMTTGMDLALKRISEKDLIEAAIHSPIYRRYYEARNKDGLT